MARGIHGLSKVSVGPAMPDPSTSYGQATKKKLFGGGQPAGGSQLTSIFFSFPLDTPRRMGLVIAFELHLKGKSIGSFLGFSVSENVRNNDKTENIC
jgi:hypothetical protein